jgi:hypothetical protein
VAAPVASAFNLVASAFRRKTELLYLHLRFSPGKTNFQATDLDAGRFAGEEAGNGADGVAEASYQRVAGMVQTHRHLVDAMPGRQQQKREAMNSLEP